ncbi:MAG: InlB B-repeat-containing protein [Clostridia bacterium]|nr:InlB B-repeat-containing protein [Clostridia bacterium]
MKKYKMTIIIAAILLTLMLTAAGGSTWLILSEIEDTLGALTQLDNLTLTYSTTGGTSIYFGESYITPDNAKVEYSIVGEQINATIPGTWKFDTDGDGVYQTFDEIIRMASGTSATIALGTKTGSAKFVLDKTALGLAGAFAFALSDDYEVSNVSVTFPTLNTVAKVGSTYYASIDGALTAANAATSATTVVVLPSYSDTDSNGINDSTDFYALETGRKATAKTISTTTTINSNVTLLIPWGSTTADDTDIVHQYVDPDNVDGTTDAAYITANETTNENAYLNPTKYCTNIVTVASTLNLSGKLTISGKQFSGVNNQITGQTYSYHGKLTIGSGGSLTAMSGSTVTVFGFIDGCDAYTDLKFSSGSNLLIPFVYYDWRSGSVTLAMRNGYQAEKDFCNSPIVRFVLPNICGRYTVYGGTIATARVTVYMPSSETEVVETPTVIGGNTAFIELPSGSRMEVFYDSSSSAIKDGKFGKLNWDFYGDTTIHALSLTLKVSDMFGSLISGIGGLFIRDLPEEITLSTAGKFLPLAYFYNIGVRSGTLNMESQDIKLLPGSNITVYSGATLKANKILIYESNPSPGRGAYGSFPSGLSAANIDVQGTLIAHTLAGRITPSTSGGKLQITAGTSASDYDLLPNSTGAVHSTSYDLASVKSDTVYYSQTTNSLKLASDRDASTDYTTTGTYRAVQRSDGTYGWFKATITLTLNANGGTGGTASVTVPADINSGITDEAALNTATEPQREGYKFAGWYLDSNGTTPYSAASVKYDTTLYAKWNELSTIVFNTNGGSAVTSVKVEITDSGISETDLNKIKNATSTKSQHTLAGWFVDEALTTAVSAEWFAGKTGTINVYAKWEEVKTYTVNLSINNSDLESTSGIFDVTSIDAPMGVLLTGLPTASNIDDETGVQYYFKGWATTTDGSVNSAIKLDDLTPTGTDADNENVYTLYAVWGTKVTVTFNAADNSKLMTTLADKVVNGGIESIYLKPGDTCNITSFNNYQYLDDGNNALDHNLYFLTTKEWKVEGSASVSNNVVTVASDATDGSTVTVKPDWQTKYSITITANALHSSDFTKSCSWSLSIYLNGSSSAAASYEANRSTSGTLGTIYVLPTDNVQIDASVTGSDNWLGSDCTVQLTGGTSTLSATATTATGTIFNGVLTTDLKITGGHG